MLPQNFRTRRPLLFLQSHMLSFQVLQDALLSSPSASKVRFSAILLLPFYACWGVSARPERARGTLSRSGLWSTVAPFAHILSHGCAHVATVRATVWVSPQGRRARDASWLPSRCGGGSMRFWKARRIIKKSSERCNVGLGVTLARAIILNTFLVLPVHLAQACGAA